MEIAGKPVRDAKRSIILNINVRDIKRGKTRDPGACAGAVALCRQERVKAARVHLKCCYIDRGAYWERYLTPEALRLNIVAFDRGGKFAPGSFKVRRPAKSNTLAALREYAQTHSDPRNNHEATGRRKRAKIFHTKTAHVRHHLAK